MPERKLFVLFLELRSGQMEFWREGKAGVFPTEVFIQDSGDSLSCGMNSLRLSLESYKIPASKSPQWTPESCGSVDIAWVITK